MSLLMRAHDGGFLNVHMPALWVISPSDSGCS